MAQGGVLRLEALNTLVERVALRDQVFAQGLGKGEVFFQLGNAGFALGRFATSFTQGLALGFKLGFESLEGLGLALALGVQLRGLLGERGNRGVACNLCGHGGHRRVLKLSLEVKVVGLAGVALRFELGQRIVKRRDLGLCALGGITGLVVGCLKFGFQ